MRETSLQAASVGKVADIGNGSYLATLTAFWAGTPEVKVAIISPREVIAAQFRRRYLMNFSYTPCTLYCMVLILLIYMYK